MSESGLTTLINQVIQGDATSLERLCQELQPELRRIAESHLRAWGAKAPAQATAVIDEALERLLIAPAKTAADGIEDRKRALSFEHRGAFFALMCGVMMRVLVDIHRREKRHQRACELVAEAPAKTPGLTFHAKVTVLEALIELDEYYLEKDARRSVNQAVETSNGATLGSSHAVIIFLHYYDDLSDNDIADKLGMKKSTVQAQRKVAEKRLRQMLEESFGE